MEAWVCVAFGCLAAFAAARLHHVTDGGWWLSLPMGAVGGLAGASLWADGLTGRLEDSRLAGLAVAAFIGGAIAGLFSGPLRHYGITALSALIRRRLVSNGNGHVSGAQSD